MGLAYIEEPLGEGLYRVRIDYGEAIRDQEISIIDQRLALLEPLKEDQEAAVDRIDMDRAAALERLDEAIESYRQAVAAQAPSDHLDQIREVLTSISTLLAEMTRARQITQLYLTDFETQLAEFEQRKELLSRLELIESTEAWCCDFTEDAPPEYPAATMEVPGEPQQIILAPGVQPWSAGHGLLQKKEMMEGHQAFFNVSILPGWQRFMPTYRIGIITALNGDDTVNVELEGVSTAQNLSIGPPAPVGEAPEGELWNVPVDYMGSGSAVFEMDDRVVVFLDKYDWNQARVIGFEKEPRPVVGLLCHPAGAPQYRAFPRVLQGTVSWRASQLTSPASLNVNYGTRGWTDGKKAVSWSNNKSTFFHRAFYRGRQADLVSMFPALYYYNAPEDYVMPWILGCVAAGDYVVVLAYTYQPQRAGNTEEQRAIALPLRRIDVLSFKYNKGFGPFWSEPTVQHSINLPATEYLSAGPAANADPNPNSYLFGRCQGFNSSPRGNTMVFFYDTDIYKFNISISEEGGVVVAREDIAQPSPTFFRPVEIISLTATMRAMEGPPCHWSYGIDSESRQRNNTEQGVWHVGCIWAAGENGTEVPSWVTYEAEVNWQEDSVDTWVWAPTTSTVGGVPVTCFGGPAYVAAARDHNSSALAGVLAKLTVAGEVFVLEQSSHSATRSWSGDLYVSGGVGSGSGTVNYSAGGKVVVFLDYQARCYLTQDWSEALVVTNPTLGSGSASLTFGQPPALYAEGNNLGDALVSGNLMTPPALRGEVPRGGNGSIGSVGVPAFPDPPPGAIENTGGANDMLSVNLSTIPLFYGPSEAIATGRIRDGFFCSVRLNSTAPIIAYMTDNPSLSGVFPEDSGVDTTANFAPIVPF